MRQTSKLLCAVACTLFCCPDLMAQNYQASPPQSAVNSWQPPTVQYNAPPISNLPTRSDSKQWWPNEPTKHDANVRPANVEIALPDVDHPTSQSGTLLTSVQESASEEMSGLLGAAQAAVPWGKNLKNRFAGVDVKKMLGSLAIVLGGYLGFVWLVRRFNSGATGKLPAEVLDVVGAAPFGPRKSLQLVRLGSKLLLLLNGPEGTHPIGEITDPTEVEHLISLCRGRHRSRSTDQKVFTNLMGRLQAGMPPMAHNRNESLAIPQSQMEPASAAPATSSRVPVAAANTTSELERIVQRLSSVVAQTNGRNVFEA